jgi:hypothetical protein
MNLLKKTPECHRELFTWVDGNKSAKTEYTLENLLDYYALAFYPATFYGSYTTTAQLELLKNKAIAEAPEWEDTEKEKLVSLVNKYGLEIVLYAIDLVDSDTYPKVEQIKECVADAELTLANLIRNRDYGV